MSCALGAHLDIILIIAFATRPENSLAALSGFELATQVGQRHMTGPFDDPNAHYLLIKNQLGRVSLWPERLSIPDGWSQAGPTLRLADALTRIDELWDHSEVQLVPTKISISRHSTPQKSREFVTE